MDSNIIAACIGAIATVIGALIATGHFSLGRSDKIDKSAPMPKVDDIAPPTNNVASSEPAEEKIFFAEGPGGAKASAKLRNGRVIVLAGSTIRSEATNSCPQSVLNERQQLVANGVLAILNGNLSFTRDQEFRTPSAASSLILGRASSGNVDWVDEQGRQLGSVKT